MDLWAWRKRWSWRYSICQLVEVDDENNKKKLVSLEKYEDSQSSQNNNDAREVDDANLSLKNAKKYKKKIVYVKNSSKKSNKKKDRFHIPTKTELKWKKDPLYKVKCWHTI